MNNIFTHAYDDKGNFLSVIQCDPQKGEHHMWGHDLYECTGEWTTDLGDKNGVIFKKIDPK